MVSSRNRDTWQKWTAFVTAACLLLPLMMLTMPSANAQVFGGNRNNPPKPGMSTGKKVLLVGGAALLYYLFRKHQANAAAKKANAGQVATNGQATPQLYRSKNGGIYYRDAQKNPVWLTAPQQGLQVSAQDLQRYAPDYNRYRGPAPAAPRGYRVQEFDDFDPSIFGGSQVPAGSNGRGNPPGPRGY
ncbi:MAG: hypothetical protein H8F28_05230 [Fibrella sp.]|nr:hypothetical protein [Armatimonadota bacterium]